MASLRILLLLAGLLDRGLASSNVATPKPSRTVGAWMQADVASLNQLKNASWKGLFDTVFLLAPMCGVAVVEGNSTLNPNMYPMVAVNLSAWNSHICQAIFHECAAQSIQVHLWLGNAPVPQMVIDNKAAREHLISSAEIFVQKHGQAVAVRGLHWDDESECAPRANLADFEKWIGFMDEFSVRLSLLGVKTSAAVQAMFGIQDVPYEKAYPCKKAPWDYMTSPSSWDKMRELVANSKLDRFFEMDTYYFTLPRYLNALDWYVENFPTNKLASSVAMSIVNPIKGVDEHVARIQSLDRTSVNYLNIFRIPVNDEWLEWVRRWKTRCAGCPVLGCWEPSVSCAKAEETVLL